ncbi:inositol-3-phosphate synthase [Candidatus Bathyarchaeota archaeon]|nr:MAG: inositol-3-phosphate synthase [Candidatus Bathyarchaeota archaeon]
MKVAIAGVGNCASALVQGVYYYRDGGNLPGLMHEDFGGYRVTDIEFVAAFDVNRDKIGRDLGEAIFMEPNCCVKFADVPKLGVEVLPAPVLDGVAPHMKEPFRVYDDDVDPVDVAEVLADVDADMLLNFVPVGSYNATRYYAEACLKAGCAFVNCIPEFIASDPGWARRFEQAGLPIAGDDIKSQVGATIVHRTLVDLLVKRGAKILETYQLNIGGNTDFLNMTMEERLKTKRISKTEAVTSLVPYEVPTRIGPSDYVDFLGDTKICYIFIRALKFGGTELTIDLKLKVEDSPNSAGVVVDVIRAVKLALDRGIAGPLVSISAWAFKHPPVQVPDDVALKWVEEFIEGKRER